MDIPIVDQQKRRRKTPADYRAIAAESGMTWLGPWVQSVKTKTWWLCPAGHKWFTRFDSIHDGHGCAKCAMAAVGLANGDSRRYQADHYHALADRHGWKVLAVKASAMIPTKAQIESGIAILTNGQDYHEIVLADWGTGNTF